MQSHRALGIEYNAGRAGKGVSSMRRKMVLVALLPILLIAAFACWPRRPDLRAFDSAGMARLETAMWRDYYEKRYGACSIISTNCRERSSASRR